MSRVCVVDDDRQVLRLLGRYLSDGGMNVDLLDSGAELLAMVKARRYDLILLDLGLPDVDGVTLLETLGMEHPGIRVMIVSARDDAANRVRCLDTGACDFVGKPFDLSELLARIRVHLRPRFESVSPDYLRTGEATLDLVRRQVILDSGSYSLPPREFLLLRHLMGKAGQVCTRTELLKEVWGYDFQADSNVVDKYVSRLRTKLPGRLIQTVPHVGYSFSAA